MKLGVEDHKIDTIFHNQKDDILEAAYETLKEWFKGQTNAVTAYINLKDALTDPDVNLQQIASETMTCSQIKG